MASFPNQQTTTSDSTDTAAGDDVNEPEPDGEQDSGRSLLARAAGMARTIADVIAPVSELLTALVQAATVAALIRGRGAL
ncbi:hypothetical protein C475_17853 [Halosimplex carlsbadense 2-9-1]|uniref:Uncharacterized protein n=1 Tax=Halosimplex carlsbadense 2-9-1 TaxID=797114 RepID=M0CGL1_9EURY|nr:hypothetical protein [Halosimplex carlsbadense]ELZ22401.1 hypothetical protein C475_17853 [Halosimplex carlsbadense 2-9-1]